MKDFPMEGSIKVSIPSAAQKLTFDPSCGSMVLTEDLIKQRLENPDWFREQE